MVPDVAESRSLVLGPLLAGVGLDLGNLADRTQIVLRAQVVALLRLMARQAGEATLGVDLAAAARPGRLGPSGETLLSGRTLRECIDAHIRHLPNLQAGVRVGLQVSGTRAHWRHAFVDSDPEQAAVLTEGIAAFFVQALRAITGQPDLPVYLVLPHRQQASMRQYEEKLRCAVSSPGAGDADLVRFLLAGLAEPDADARPVIPGPRRSGGSQRRNAGRRCGAAQKPAADLRCGRHVGAAQPGGQRADAGDRAAQPATASGRHGQFVRDDGR
ncbi:AraC family transcriptional regulator ligand-binding domain-containing protein [Cereibacter sphaeroides]|uniref:AraC family transcriptional regulator ligand-binding domain-containing protein n=1 Tax=Cereibacter sphaeroides TaxID=1063 RepID=UPI0039908EB9